MGSPHKSKVTNIMDKEKELLEQETVTPAISEESDNNFLALLPLKNVVLLPKSILPIVVARPSSIKSVEYALKHNKIIFISAQKDPDIEHPTENDIYQYGTRAVILQVMRTPNGQLKILVEGINRAKIVEAMQQDDFTGVYIEDLPTKKPKTKSEQEATWRTLKTLYTDYAKLNEKAPQDLIETDKSPADIDYVVDTIAVHLNLSFDEIDKMSVDMHGDPASALLEVLDPEQNKTFVDHFLDAEYDLSKVMFITTANHIDSIPYPLYDRMEIIHLSGYTNAEKLTIAKKFLMTKNLKAYGLEKTQFKMSEQLIETVIAHYTKEAGVRQLERVLAKIMRKAIQELLKDKKLKSITVTAELLRTWLGHPPFKQNRLEKEPKIGLATGLAWTELGGEIMETEVSVVPGKGGFMLTGQLGEVMQESGHAALSYIRSRVADLNIPKNFNSTKDIHIHLPEGATPKDGPSAGITLCTSIVSALTKNPVKPHIAMTGEITLRGRVLAIGGVKEKLLAAQQYGIKTVLIPHENKEDVEEVLKEADINLSIKFIKNMDQVLEYALTNPPFEKQVKVKKTTAKKTTKKRK